MNKKISPFISKLSAIILAASFFFALHGTSNAGTDKDLILILDTSLSMAGSGGKNILPQVKKSIPVYIDELDDNDSITLITFDSDVKISPTIYIGDEKNKKSLIKFISGIKATGKWTYTKKMITSVLQKAQELEARDNDRQQVIVIMTDALDDPPPGKINARLNIKEVSKSYKDKNWFVFFINFGKISENSKLSRLQREIKKNITAYTEIIDAKDDPRKGIEDELKKNIDKMAETRKADEGFSFTSLFIALLIIAIILAVIFYLKGFSLLKVAGGLEYWDHTLLEPYIETFDMTKQNSKEIIIGKKAAHLIIREIDSSSPFIIAAVKDNNIVKNIVKAGQDSNIEFINCDPNVPLKNGDMFRTANYTFKYISVG